jgi:DNA-binding transcriptional LysR family regulator
LPAFASRSFPIISANEELHDGRLVLLLPDWSKQQGLIHLVFTTKRGLPPAVGALIDHLAIGFKEGETLDSASEFNASAADNTNRAAPA